MIRTKKPYALTAMQQAFVDAYLSKPLGERDIKTAALAAGYSPHTAHAAGRKLMTNQLIRRKILEQSPARAIEMAHIDSAWLLKELANLWETPLDSLFDENGRMLPIDQMNPQAQKLIAGFEVNELTTTEVSSNGKKTTTFETRVGKIRLVDRMRALEDIGKHTKINAFGTKEAAEANKSFAELLRAATKALKPSTLQELDITPTESGD